MISKETALLKKKNLNYRKSDVTIGLSEVNCYSCSKREDLTPYMNRCHEIGLEMPRYFSVNIEYLCDKWKSFDGKELPVITNEA
jgi:hypothetical protein